MTRETEEPQLESTSPQSDLPLRMRRLVGVALTCYWVFLFASTHIKLPKDALPHNTDKAAHFLAYSGLTFLLGLWVSLRRPMTAARYGFIFAIIAAYGIVDELTQIPVGRTADAWDWVADCVGALLGLGALVVLQSVVTQVWFRRAANGTHVKAAARRDS